MTTKPVSSLITAGPGLRIRPGVPDPAAEEWVSALRAHATPDVSDACNRLYAPSPEIRHLAGETHLVAMACTVKVPTGDNLMVHKALDVALRGQVVVIDTSGSARNAVVGDMIANKARHRGIAGFVIDGFVRDLAGVQDAGLPVFARGVTPIGPFHRGPGEINYPVCCGGVVVNPGDIVLGDADGVVVVPHDSAEALLARLDASAAARDGYAEAVRRGDFSMAWVDRALEEAGLGDAGD